MPAVVTLASEKIADQFASHSAERSWIGTVRHAGMQVVGAPAAPGPLFLVEGLLLACALLSSAYFLAHLMVFDYGRDQGIYAVVAERMLRGEVPYRDVWDFKPPGIFFVFAAAQMLFGSGMHAVRLCEAAAFASLIYAFAILSRRHMGSAGAGIFGGALAVLTHVQLEFWHTAQPASFGAVALAWALVCASYEPATQLRRRALLQRAAWCGAGALYALAALLKPPLAGGILSSMAIVGLRRWQSDVGPRRWTSFRAPTLAFASGAAIPLLLAGSYFVVNGAWGDLHDALFVFAPQYTALNFRAGWFGPLLLHVVEQWALAFSACYLPGLGLLIALPLVGSREREGVAHAAGAIAFSLLGVALQGKLFPYHYGATLPLTALLAGWGFWKLWLAVRSRPLGIVAVVALVGVLLGTRTATRDLEDSFWARCQMRVAALLDPELRTALNDRLYSVVEVDAGNNRRVAAWLRAHTPGDASIYIWGFEPAIYAQAQRRPASRYIYNVPQRVVWAREKSRRVLLQELEQSRPAAIAVEHGDRFVWVTGDQLDSATVLQGFAGLRSLMRREYRRAVTIGRFDLYLRKARPKGPAARRNGVLRSG